MPESRHLLLQDTALRYFHEVAQCGSLSEASARLHVAASAISRQIAALEARLGTPLFERLKGQLTPTPMGEELLTRGQRMEAEIAARCHLVSDRQTQVKGVVRITAVDTLASHYLARQLADLRSRYPELAIEIIASSRSLDLGRREADIAVRMTQPRQEQLIARCVGVMPLGFHAHKRYLDKHGTPSSLADLAGKVVEVQTDSSAEAALKDNAELSATFGTLQTTPDYNTAFMDLEQGAVDAFEQWCFLVIGNLQQGGLGRDLVAAALKDLVVGVLVFPLQPLLGDQRTVAALGTGAFDFQAQGRTLFERLGLNRKVL